MAAARALSNALRGVFGEYLCVMLQSTCDERIGRSFRSSSYRAVDDKRAPAHLKARSPGFGNYPFHIGMHREVDTGRLDIPRFTVSLSNRTDDAIANDVIESQIDQIDAAQRQVKAERHQPLQPRRCAGVDRSKLLQRHALALLRRNRVYEQIVRGG